jgi:hypothetical protein
MLRYVISIAVILLALLIYVLTQRAYRLFAKQHPELGPFRDEGKGCGSCTGEGCGTSSCESEED